MNINVLSDEILIHIIEHYIDCEAFFNFSKTCKRLHYLCWKHEWTKQKQLSVLLHYLPLEKKEINEIRQYIGIPTNQMIEFCHYSNHAIHNATMLSMKSFYTHQFLFFVFLHYKREDEHKQQQIKLSSCNDLFTQLMKNYSHEYQRWNSAFPKQFLVSFDSFYDQYILQRYLFVEDLEGKKESFQYFFSSFQFVSIYHWFIILDQFGPTLEHVIDHFLMISMPFLGHISFQDATHLLLKKGSSKQYIIRNSETYPEQITISYLTPEKSVRHRRKPCGMTFDLFIHKFFPTHEPLMLTKC